MSGQLSLVFDYDLLDDEDASFVREKTESIRAEAKRSVQGVLTIGRDLTDVKERLGHGRFLGWLEVEFGWKFTTARNLMRAWAAFKCATVAHLEPIDLSAIYLLAAKSTSGPVREVALELAAEGERITKAKVEAGRKAATRLTKAKAKAGRRASSVKKLVDAGAEAAEDLPPDSGPAEVRKAIRDAMRQAAGVKKTPSPKEADRLARETGRMVWGSDNRWHDGTPAPTADQEAEHRLFTQFVVAVHQIEVMRIAPERVAALIAPWDVDNWLGRLPAVAGFLGAVHNALRSLPDDVENRDAA